MTLREELGGKPVVTAPPASYRLLCPTGWQRVPASALTEVFGEMAVAKFKEAGRPDLVLQMRGMLARLRIAMRTSRVFEAYLPPVLDGNPQPAVLTVAPFVRPGDATWEGSLVRVSGRAEVVVPDFTVTRMWMWTKDESSPADPGEPTLRTRARHYVVPASDEADERRGLHFVHTVLVADDSRPPASDEEITPSRLTEVLLETGDVILSTLRWVDRSER